MALDHALMKVQQAVPECVAVGYVDMSTGMILAVKTVDSHPQEVIDLVAAATADLFQGPSVTTIEKLFRKSRGQPEDGSHYFQEMLIFSENLLHVFLRCKKRGGHVLVVVCRASASIGMVLSKTRLSLSEVELAV